MPPFSSSRPNPYKRAPRNTPLTETAPRPTYKPSVYQQAIIDWLITGTGNAIVDAKAGSGKTSTLCMLSDVVPTTARAAFLAFNKSIQEELQRRLPSHVTAATFHSVCNGALRRHPQIAPIAQQAGRYWIDKNKVHGIIDSLLDSYMDGESYRKGVKQLVGLMKANALLPTCPASDIMALINNYNIEFVESAQDAGVEQGIKMAREVLTINNETLTTIDFDDMLYLAYIMDAPMMKYSHLFVDEAQDTNLIQRLLIARMVSPATRVVFVGDPSQAIYGFRGADSEAMDNIARDFNCVTFPLSISYRCPRKVIALAQRIVPTIEARENAPEGTVKKLDAFELANFTSADLVVCRNTAPIISLGFRMLRAHKPVKIMGREIGEQLIATIQKMRAATLEELADNLEAYTNREIEKAAKKRQEQRIEQLADQRDAVIAIIYGLPEDAQTVYEVIAVIRRLFTDEGAGKQTTLSTVHKAKGMESTNVFILDGHLMPSKYATQPWQQVQEENLKYVAVTRALDSLFFIESDKIQ